MEEMKPLSKKVPMPSKTNLYLPVKFWSTVLASLDSKVQGVCESYGFGIINLRIVIHNKRVSDIYFNDEVRIRGLVEQYINEEGKLEKI